MKQVIAILVRNRPGVLMRVAGLFYRRGFNIKSLAVGETQSAGYSRLTVVMNGSDNDGWQMVKQLRKLVDVYSVMLMHDAVSINRGMALLKVNGGSSRPEILKLAEIFRAHVVEVSETVVMFEITGEDAAIDAFKNALEPYGIREMVRTGLLSLQRGENTICGGMAEGQEEQEAFFYSILRSAQ